VPTMLDRIRMVQRGERPPPPIAALIGFEVTAVDPGQAVIEFEASERRANPIRTSPAKWGQVSQGTRGTSRYETRCTQSFHRHHRS
jgi:hypothetical protein